MSLIRLSGKIAAKGLVKDYASVINQLVGSLSTMNDEFDQDGKISAEARVFCLTQLIETLGTTALW